MFRLARSRTSASVSSPWRRGLPCHLHDLERYVAAERELLDDVSLEPEPEGVVSLVWRLLVTHSPVHDRSMLCCAGSATGSSEKQTCGPS